MYIYIEKVERLYTPEYYDYFRLEQLWVNFSEVYLKFFI